MTHRTPEQIEQSRQKAARTRELGRRLDDLTHAAQIVAKRAGEIELHAAKNNAAGYDKGATNKLQRAGELRRIAAFLADPRLHQLIRSDERLIELLMGEPPERQRGYLNVMAPRRIDPAEVKPTRSNGWNSGYYKGGW